MPTDTFSETLKNAVHAIRQDQILTAAKRKAQEALSLTIAAADLSPESLAALSAINAELFVAVQAFTDALALNGIAGPDAKKIIFTMLKAQGDAARAFDNYLARFANIIQ